MLKTHEKFRFLDKSGQNTFFMEVNWEPENPKNNECKVIKVTFPDDKVCYIESKELTEMIFAIGKAEDQRNMIPQTLETIHHYKTVLGIKATKAIAKDEMVNFPIELSVPCSALRQDVIGSLPKEYKNGRVNGGVPLIRP